jgi:hypothetical protein
MSNSVELIKSLHNIMNLLDNITDVLPEGIYIQLCNELKIANSNASKETLIQYIQVERERITNNPIVVHHERMTRAERKKRRVLDNATKLKNGYKMCPNCNKIVLNLWRHQHQTQICVYIEDVKDIVAVKKTSDITDFMLNLNDLQEAITNFKERRKFVANDAFIDKCWVGYYGAEIYRSMVGEEIN